MLKPESRQAGAFHSQSNLNEETKQINETAVQPAAFFPPHILAPMKGH